MSQTVLMRTSLGTMAIQLFSEKAPETVANFLRYVEDQFYHGTLFHRVIPGFMIQGGGYTSGLVPKTPRPPIRNESANGLRNERGTLAMARKAADPDSATCQFFINLIDSPKLDRAQGGAAKAQCVFGRIIEGMDVADAIASVNTEDRGGHYNVPVRDVTIDRARLVRIDPSWSSWNEGVVKRLAQTIIDERRFEMLPILADALEEAGCTEPDILRHCREGGHHFRGCWIVDLLLGKE